MALRNKAFGSAQDFVWSSDSEYAIRENSSTIKVFKNFKEKKSFKPEGGADGIFGGYLLGVKSVTGLALYDWENGNLVRRIETQPKHVFWSESGELVCLATDEAYFILRFDVNVLSAARASNYEAASPDGLEDAFEILGEVQEVVKTGLWVGDCFIYTNGVNRINYYVGGEIVTVSHLDRTMYLLGYVAKENRLYLGDKELNIVSYSLLLSVLEYQTAVMRKDFEIADRILPSVPSQYRTRVAHFLEKQGYKKQALSVSTDVEHKFELAIQLQDLAKAHLLAKEASSPQKWRQLSELATAQADLELAQECLHQAQDYGGLLLLATSSGNSEMVKKLAESTNSNGKNNISFLSYLLLGDLDKCLQLLIETDRLPEAAFFARSYLPSKMSYVVGLWKDSLSKTNIKASESLANPDEYENLFPNYQESLKTEVYLQAERKRQLPAAAYANTPLNHERNCLEEMKAAETKEPSFSLNEQIANIKAEVLQASYVEKKQEDVILPPPLIPTKIVDDFEDVDKELEEELENMNLDDIGSTGINIDAELSDDDDDDYA